MIIILIKEVRINYVRYIFCTKSGIKYIIFLLKDLIIYPINLIESFENGNKCECLNGYSGNYCEKGIINILLVI